MKIKKLLFVLLITTCFMGLEVRSQVVFYEDFDGVGGPTAGGPGTYSFPNGWLLRNVDNRIPASAVAFVNEAWERREDFSHSVIDSVAFSTSWYSPTGAADDWMWTPMISIPANSVLSWNAVTYDPDYRDGYEVRIMTGVAPTGGNGVMGNQVTNSTVIYSIAAEATTWTSHTVSLASYAGQNVYIGFRNNSNDKFLLLIDDIKVEVPLLYDAKVIRDGFLTEYTQIPLQQAVSIPLSANIKNMGINSLTNVRLKANVYNSSHVLLNSSISPALPTLASGASNSFICDSFTPADTGKFIVAFFPLINETDQDASNDTVNLEQYISDTVYARDDGVINGSLGIGAGNGGFLGQQFTIQTPTSIRSVTMHMNSGYLNENLAAAIWKMAGGVPTTIAATTDTLLYDTTSAALYTLMISNGPFDLMPGDYAVTAIEFDSTLALSLTSAIFTTGKTWINWPTSPTGGWANNEDFGTSFAKSYYIRPNIYNCPAITIDLLPLTAACDTCHTGSVSATAGGGTAPYTFYWSNGASTQNISGLLPGIYTVTVADAYHCKVVDSVTVANSYSVKEEKPSDIKIVPNPNTGLFYVITDHITLSGGKIEVFNIMGERIYQTSLMSGENINQTIDLGNIPSGSYFVRLTYDKGIILQRMTIM